MLDKLEQFKIGKKYWNLGKVKKKKFSAYIAPQLRFSHHQSQLEFLVLFQIVLTWCPLWYLNLNYWTMLGINHDFVMHELERNLPHLIWSCTRDNSKSWMLLCSPLTMGWAIWLFLPFLTASWATLSVKCLFVCLSSLFVQNCMYSNNFSRCLLLLKLKWKKRVKIEFVIQRKRISDPLSNYKTFRYVSKVSPNAFFICPLVINDHGSTLK